MNRTNRTKHIAYLLGLISACSNFSSKINAGNHSSSSSKVITKEQARKHKDIETWAVGNSSIGNAKCTLDFKTGELKIKATSKNKKTIIREIFIKGRELWKPYVKSISFEGNIVGIYTGSLSCTCRCLNNLVRDSYYENHYWSPRFEYFERCHEDTHYELKSEFEGCTNLTSITLPESVTEIGDGAFKGCTNLASIIIPDKVEKIGSGAFKDCTNLTSIIIPDKVKKIGNNAFANCISLSTINFKGKEPKIEAIGCNAFANCISLTSITLPKSIEKIGKNVFVGCKSLSNINIPYGIELINGIDVDIDSPTEAFVPIYYSNNTDKSSMTLIASLVDSKVIGTINDKNDLVNLGLSDNCINFII